MPFVLTKVRRRTVSEYFGLMLSPSFDQLIVVGRLWGSDELYFRNGIDGVIESRESLRRFPRRLTRQILTNIALRLGCWSLGAERCVSREILNLREITLGQHQRSSRFPFAFVINIHTFIRLEYEPALPYFLINIWYLRIVYPQVGVFSTPRKPGSNG